jgi:hypothetical protein
MLLIMSTAIKISDKIANEAKISAKVTRRSMAGQVEYWAYIGKIAEDNPDLSFSIINDILLGREQLKEGLGTAYLFGEGD